MSNRRTTQTRGELQPSQRTRMYFLVYELRVICQLFTNVRDFHVIFESIIYQHTRELKRYSSIYKNKEFMFSPSFPIHSSALLRNKCSQKFLIFLSRKVYCSLMNTVRSIKELRPQSGRNYCKYTYLIKDLFQNIHRSLQLNKMKITI